MFELHMSRNWTFPWCCIITFGTFVLLLLIVLILILHYHSKSHFLQCWLKIYRWYKIKLTSSRSFWWILGLELIFVCILNKSQCKCRVWGRWCRTLRWCSFRIFFRIFVRLLSDTSICTTTVCSFSQLLKLNTVLFYAIQTFLKTYQMHWILIILQKVMISSGCGGH